MTATRSVSSPWPLAGIGAASSTAFLLAAGQPVALAVLSAAMLGVAAAHAASRARRVRR